eukprot:352554-Chlamydomonas_euryale.AAC.11
MHVRTHGGPHTYACMLSCNRICRVNPILRILCSSLPPSPPLPPPRTCPAFRLLPDAERNAADAWVVNSCTVKGPSQVGAPAAEGVGGVGGVWTVSGARAVKCVSEMGSLSGSSGCGRCGACVVIQPGIW